MDNVTHSLTGLMISRAGLNRWFPQATAVLIMSSNVPDLDVVSAIGGALSYLDYHRHLTHAFALLPIMAIIPLLVLRIFVKQFSWWRGYIVSLIGVLGHLLFDLTNNYGIRLSLPFSSRWYQLDIVNVIDPWILGIMLFCIAWPALSKLVSSEIGIKAKTGQGWAVFALLLIGSYIGARAYLHQEVLDALSTTTFQGATPRRVSAWPSAYNPMLWTGCVETDEFYAVQPVTADKPFDPTEARIYYKAQTTPAIEAARRNPVVQRYLQWAQAPHWITAPSGYLPGGTYIRVIDLRFGTPGLPRFMTTVEVNASNQVDSATFQFGPLRRR